MHLLFIYFQESDEDNDLRQELEEAKVFIMFVLLRREGKYQSGPNFSVKNGRKFVRFGQFFS